MPTHVIELSMQELSKYFKMPEKAVAKHLGICLTSLKKICRANGINRWPYRKVRSVPVLQDERICKLAASRERFEIYRPHGRIRALVQCGLYLHLPLPSTQPCTNPRYDQYDPCHSPRLVIRIPEAPGGELAGGPTSRPMAR